jgi:hypothetical protein
MTTNTNNSENLNNLDQLENLIEEYEKLPLTMSSIKEHTKINTKWQMCKDQYDKFHEYFNTIDTNKGGVRDNILDDKIMEDIIKNSDDIIKQDISLMNLDDLVNVHRKLNSNVNKLDKFMQDSNMEIMEFK